MNDLISRSELIESLIHCDGLGRRGLEAVLQTINELPTIEAEPVIHGEWLDTCPEYNGGYKRNAHKCSNCGDYYTTEPEDLFFCPRCGADMRGKRMSDLISRSELLEEIKRELERGRAIDPFFDGTLFHYTGIKAIIENQPIAYDVEQVVKELEEIKQIMLSPKNADCFGEPCTENDCMACVINKAIEIVKGGGVNERD